MRYTNLLQSLVKTFSFPADNISKGAENKNRKWSDDTEQAEQIFCWQADRICGRLVRKGSNSVISDGKETHIDNEILLCEVKWHQFQYGWCHFNRCSGFCILGGQENCFLIKWDITEMSWRDNFVSKERSHIQRNNRRLCRG